MGITALLASHRLRLFLVLFAAVVLTVACGGNSPVSPSATSGATALVASDVSGAKRPAAVAVKPITTAPKAGAAIHLASYTGIGAAVHGWETLRGRYAELTPLKPLYVSTDIAGKGPMIRLFASGAAPEKLRQICSDLQSKQAYCALNP